MYVKQLRWIIGLAVSLAWGVVMLGAYTRLTNAGLGCPDWPGCYGKMNLPVARDALTEMVHRYCAGALGCFILLSLGLGRRYTLPWVLVGLVLVQAALGMWTVTLKLLPVVVMGHLLGGILIFTLLFCFCLQLREQVCLYLPGWYKATLLGVLIVLSQIALGGWVSSNYAGLACFGFPECNGSWLPALKFMPAFDFFAPVGANYQGGLLENEARVTIQMIHRIGACVTAVYVLGLSFLMMMHVKVRRVRWMLMAIMMLIVLQFILGMLNVIYLLPLPVAVAHNGIGALLLACMAGLSYLISGEKDDACAH